MLNPLNHPGGPLSYYFYTQVYLYFYGFCFSSPLSTLGLFFFSLHLSFSFFPCLYVSLSCPVPLRWVSVCFIFKHPKTEHQVGSMNCYLTKRPQVLLNYQIKDTKSLKKKKKKDTTSLCDCLGLSKNCWHA